jgi:hypothetical protein
VPAVNGGQKWTHVPVQLLAPGVSLADVYNVKPAESTSIVLPRVALLAVSSVVLAVAAGLRALVLALGVAVVAGLIEGVVVEELLPPQAALIDKAKSRPVDARSTDKRLFIGLPSLRAVSDLCLSCPLLSELIVHPATNGMREETALTCPSGLNPQHSMRSAWVPIASSQRLIEYSSKACWIDLVKGGAARMELIPRGSRYAAR